MKFVSIPYNDFIYEILIYEMLCEIFVRADTFKSSIPQISLKLQRLAVQSIRNSDTFEILYTSNTIKTAETGSPKYQKF